MALTSTSKPQHQNQQPHLDRRHHARHRDHNPPRRHKRPSEYPRPARAFCANGGEPRVGGVGVAVLVGEVVPAVAVAEEGEEEEEAGEDGVEEADWGSGELVSEV